MAKTREPTNPFYVLLVIVGVAFFVTAAAYGTMAYRAIMPAADKASEHELMRFLDEHGMQLMAVEIGVLAAATFAAMWLDRFRARPIEDPSKTASGDSER